MEFSKKFSVNIPPINQRSDSSGKPSAPKTALTRTPLVLIIDISSSMEAVREKLNKATSSLLEQMKSNVTLYGTVDILVIFFNGSTSTIVDFKQLEGVDVSDLVINECKGCTYMGQAILEGIHMADEYRLKLYKESGSVASPNQPLVFLLTDGQPDAGVGATDEEKEKVRLAFEEACKLIKSKEADKKIVFIAAGIEHENSNVSVDMLRKLTSFPDRVVRFEGTETNFKKFCNFILKGTTLVSKPDELVANMPDFNC